MYVCVFKNKNVSFYFIASLGLSLFRVWMVCQLRRHEATIICISHFCTPVYTVHLLFFSLEWGRTCNEAFFARGLALKISLFKRCIEETSKYSETLQVLRNVLRPSLPKILTIFEWRKISSSSTQSFFKEISFN